MNMKKLTKREKVIIGISLVVVAVVAIKFKKDAIKATAEYEDLAGKLCEGGVWKAVLVSKEEFTLVPVNCCGGGNCKLK